MRGRVRMCGCVLRLRQLLYIRHAALTRSCCSASTVPTAYFSIEKHIMVGGADNDLRKALAIASARGHRECSRALHRSITSRCELEDPR